MLVAVAASLIRVALLEARIAAEQDRGDDPIVLAAIALSVLTGAVAVYAAVLMAQANPGLACTVRHRDPGISHPGPASLSPPF